MDSDSKLQNEASEPKGQEASSCSGPVWTIYCHTHIITGRRYIGLTKKRMLQRWNEHVYNSRSKRGKGCRHFWNAIRSYGNDAFSHEVLETCDTLEVANKAEEQWIAAYDTMNPEKGFNLCLGKHTPHPVSNPWDRPEHREKCIAAARKKALDPEYIAKLSAASQKSMSDPLVLAKISRTMKARASTPEGRQQRIDASKPGKILSEDHRAKIRASSRSNDPDVKEKISRRVRLAFEDPEVRERVFAASKAAMARSEVKEKISRSNKNTGKKLSEEVRNKISQALRKAPKRTHCKRGHSTEHVNMSTDGRRRCIECRNDRQVARRKLLGLRCM